MVRESRLKYSALASAIGALITAMNGLNSRFSDIVGIPAAAIAIHVAGLVAVSAILFARREEKRPGRLPLYYYAGGVVGVGTVYCSNYAFSSLGASLSVALALIGQTLFSLAADATGMLGRERVPLRARRLPGIGLALAGAAIMAGSWRANAPAMLAALAAGVFPGLSFVLNAELGRRKGLFRSSRMNFITGLATSLAIFAILRAPLASSARAVVSAGPFLALGGGLMGVAVVSAMNLILPRIPVFSATILMFSGQAAAGLLIDSASGSLDARKLVGTAILISGLAIDTAFGRLQPRE
jgi:bacterial/archaeal transporter family-2 protein